ncbi:Dak1 domain-containing protein [Sporodiniella umbellata]|nr:Dak1 domain-containing protein [Sporodiniella umbellata]
MAATVMAIKLAGALAARGAPLEKVRQIVQYTIDHSATLGVAFDHCHVPGSLSLSQLASDELELGMGIHNESGFLKTPLMDAHTMVGRMMDLLTCQEDKDRAYLSLDPGTPVVILVNNLGGLPAIELHLAVKETVEHVLAMGLTLERVYAGSFLSSLNMPGFSISIMTLQDPSILSLLDHPVSLSGWPQAPALSFSSLIEDHPPEQKKEQATLKSSAQVVSVPKMIQAIQGASHAVIQAEPEITQYDTLLGDGDCGQTLKTAALAILDQLPNYPLLSTSDTLLAIAETIETSVGGTSSALYCIFLNALANGLVQHKTADQVWVMALEDALQVLMSYTKARVGDRTLMDTLCPFVESLKTQGFFRSVELAKEGAESTRTMPSHLGRSSYLSSEQVMEANVPDAGAYGLAKLLSGMANGLKES